jgi:protein ImuA
MQPVRAEALEELRHQVAQIEANVPTLADAGHSVRLGIPAIDTALGGGLPVAAVHELAPALPIHSGAAQGFAVALAAQSRGSVLWVETDFARMENGAPYGPGLAFSGLALDRLVLLTVPRSIDVLWAMEEALRSREVMTVIGEVPDDHTLDDGPATRRLSLTARDSGGFGLLLRQRPSPAASAAATRWQVAAAPGAQDQFGGLGRITFALSLTKNRNGPCGHWLIAWDHHDRVFQEALSVSVAEAARDRSDRARLAYAG